MANEKTVVEYDASKAMAEIGRLERRIQELEGKTKRSFDKMSQSSEALEKGMKGLNAPAGSLVENFRKMAAGVTPLGVAIGATSGAIIALLGDIVELPAALRNTEERVKALTDGWERLADITKSGIKLEASIDSVKIEEQIKAISLRRSGLQEERVDVTERRDALKDKLEAEKNFQTQRKNITQQANRDIARLEDLAGDIREKRFLRGIEGQELPQALDRLLTAASQLRNKGGQENFQRAERLIDKATSLAGEKGDSRDQSRVAAEEGRLVQAIEETVRVRGEQRNAELAVDQASRQRLSSLEQEIDLLNKRATAIRNESKLLSADANRKTHAAGDVHEVEGQRTAALERQVALQQALARFTAERDAVTATQDLSKRAFALTSGVNVKEQQEQVNLATKLAGGAFGNLQKGTAEGNQQAIQFLQQLQITITRLESGRGVTGALKFDVNNLKAGAEFLQKVVEADEKFVQSRGSTERFSLGEVNDEADRYAESLERAATARERLASPIPGLGLPPVTPNAPTPAPAAQSGLPAAQGPTQPQNITVNANVKGGIIDAETTRTITDIIRREIRRGTGPGSK